MSGKSEGKHRNRAAQSEQHGFQEPVMEKPYKPQGGEKAGGRRPPGKWKHERVLDKLRRLEVRRRQQEEEKQGQAGKAES